MYLPPLQPISSSHFYVSGDVTIHPSAAIAPGVLLQADPESRLLIGAGACIGMGTVLHAHQGVLEVETGVTLGAGVLIVGKGTIGANACIGTATTIFNYSPAAGEVVPPLSLLGATGRQIAETQPTKTQAEDTPSPPVPESAATEEPLPETQTAETNSATTANASTAIASGSAQGLGTVVYGQASLNQLLSTLLPHRQALNQPLQNDQSPPSSPP